MRQIEKLSHDDKEHDFAMIDAFLNRAKLKSIL